MSDKAKKLGDDDMTDASKMTDLLTAIAAAMGDVQKVGKGDRNKHDGYNFASIDNFLSLVNPICAKHGLVIASEELSREDFTRKGRNGDIPWMRVSFAFTVYHVSGQSLPAMTRSVEVMRNGAQAYGSAQSYCLKQLLRGLFLIPTGDKDDADFHAKDESEIVSHRQPPRQSAPAEAPAEAISAAVSLMQEADTLDRLRAIFQDMPPYIKAHASVIAAKDKRKAELLPAMPPGMDPSETYTKLPDDTPKLDDELPY